MSWELGRGRYIVPILYCHDLLHCSLLECHGLFNLCYHFLHYNNTVLTDSAIYSFEPLRTVAMPKSPSLTNPVLVKKIFSVLISLKKNTKCEKLFVAVIWHVTITKQWWRVLTVNQFNLKSPKRDLSKLHGGRQELIPPSHPGSWFSTGPAVGKQATLERFDLKSENSGLPVELNMSSFQMNDQQTPWNFTSSDLYYLFSKSIKIDPVTELPRVTCFVKSMQ